MVVVAEPCITSRLDAPRPDAGGWHRDEEEVVLDLWLPYPDVEPEEDSAQPPDGGVPP